MAQVVSFALSEWDAAGLSDDMRQQALTALESGCVLFFPSLAFDVGDLVELSTSYLAGRSRKNMSFDGATGKVTGVESDSMMSSIRIALGRYQHAAHALLNKLFPSYTPALIAGRTSFRPREILERKTSWRKDDSRLHVDSFPSTPVHGNRILRVFSNVNPYGEPRHWTTGEAFDRMASRFVPRLAPPLPGSDMLLMWLCITKTRRTPYDQYMLRLHDAIKRDDDYQREAEQSRFAFTAGSSWMAYTDQVLHAATKGRGALEQTFYLPVTSMCQPARSPLRTLERLIGKSLT